MKQSPNLTDFGLGLPYGVPFRLRKKIRKLEQKRLLESEERFESTCEWLQGICKSGSINTMHSSYFIKHIAERRIGGHLSNGVFIAAAIHCGFDVKESKKFPNIFLNINEESLQEKYEESLLYEKYPECA